MKGTAWLIVRQGFVSVLTVVGVLALSLLLSPTDFALYGYASTLILLAAAVGDLGMGASLIRGEPTDRDIRGSFALQLVVWGPTLGALAVASSLAAPYGFGVATSCLLLGGAFLLCLQSLPTALMERSMSFKAIAALEVVQRVTFIGIAVTLAAVSAAQWSIPLALMASAAIGYPAALILAGWRWRPGPARGEPLFRGFSSDWWQSRLANQLTYATYPLLGGVLFSTRDVGLMVWALGVSSVPALLAPTVSRAVLPALSRVGRDEQVRIFRLLFRGLLMIAFPMCAALFVCASPLTSEIFGEKWLDGIPLLRLEAVTTILGVAMTPLAPLLFLTLASTWVKRLMVAWLIGVVAASVALAPVVSYKAISVAQILAASAALLVTDRLLRRHRHYSPVRDVVPGILATGIAVGALLPIAPHVDGIYLTVALFALTACLQFAVMLALKGGVHPRVLLDTLRKDAPMTSPPHAAKT